MIVPLRARIDRSVIRKASELREGDSRKYIDFLKSLPCFVTGADPCDDPHHLMRGTPTGSRGTGMRAPDRYALPVCRWVHDAAHHVELGDEEMFTDLGFDVRSLTNELWSLRHNPDRHVLARRLLFNARQAAQLKVGLGNWMNAVKALNARFGAAA